jgi:hypothetical protein
MLLPRILSPLRSYCCIELLKGLKFNISLPRVLILVLQSKEEYEGGSVIYFTLSFSQIILISLPPTQQARNMFDSTHVTSSFLVHIQIIRDQQQPRRTGKHPTKPDK